MERFGDISATTWDGTARTDFTAGAVGVGADHAGADTGVNVGTVPGFVSGTAIRIGTAASSMPSSAASASSALGRSVGSHCSILRRRSRNSAQRRRSNSGAATQRNVSHAAVLAHTTTRTHIHAALHARAQGARGHHRKEQTAAHTSGVDCREGRDGGVGVQHGAVFPRVVPRVPHKREPTGGQLMQEHANCPNLDSTTQNNCRVKQESEGGRERE
jgi:hypothetical protein